MYGEGMLRGLLQGLPNFLRPEGEYSERLAITSHFQNTGLVYGDSIGVPLASGLADWGAAGILIYAVMAVYAISLWRICQSTPRLLTALLMTEMACIFSISSGRTMFVRDSNHRLLLVVLLAFGPLLAPRSTAGNDLTCVESPDSSCLPMRWKRTVPNG